VKKTKAKKKTQAVAGAASVIVHGAKVLNAVTVDSYNLEIRSKDGFLGDKASKKALGALIDKWRAVLDADDDPFGKPSKKVGKRAMDEALAVDDLAALGVAESVAEEFAQTLKDIIVRFLKAPGWRGTQRIAVGGGVRSTRIGARAVARAALLLRAERVRVELQLIDNDPDDAGLLGAAYLAPPWMFKGFDGLLAIDIGGTNMRAGIVATQVGRDGSLRKTVVWRREKWRHKDDDPSRTSALDELAHMLGRLIKAAKRKSFRLAPFIGIGCPGIIAPDGTIARGAQNLPGDWSGKKFSLAKEIGQRVAPLAKFDPTIVIHNDAVVQGLSEIPRMTGVKRWAILTAGTGLGNARFTNTTADKAKKRPAKK
jgi:hypothetical protein